MSNAVNGTSYLLYVKDSNNVYQAVASSEQKSLTRTRTMAPVDVSSKASVYDISLHGRKSSTLSIDNLFIDGDAGIAAMEDAYDNQTDVVVRIYKSGAAVKQATCQITSLTDTYADQTGAGWACELKVNGAWTVV